MSKTDSLSLIHQKQLPEVFYKKGVLRNFAKFTGKHLCQSLCFNRPQACNFIKKETLAEVFSCEFCEISKKTFFTEHLWVAASNSLILLHISRKAARKRFLNNSICIIANASVYVITFWMPYTFFIFDFSRHKVSFRC